MVSQTLSITTAFAQVYNRITITLHFCSVVSSIELTDIERRLPKELMRPIEKEFLLHLEFEFHTSSHNIIQATTTGLRVAIGHLVKVR